jgi:hypothetical protein
MENKTQLLSQLSAASEFQQYFLKIIDNYQIRQKNNKSHNAIQKEPS